jgi:hypothetical protein
VKGTVETFYFGGGIVDFSSMSMKKYDQFATLLGEALL